MGWGFLSESGCRGKAIRNPRNWGWKGGGCSLVVASLCVFGGGGGGVGGKV